MTLLILSVVLLQEPPAGVIRLTLREATEQALRHNLALEIARYSPLAAEQSIESAWGAFDWVAHGNATRSSSAQPTSSLLQSSESERMDVTLGMRQITPLGISYDLFGTLDRSENNLSFSTLNPSYSSSLGMTVTVPTLRGFGLDAAYSTVVIARTNHAISERDFELALIDTVYNVEKTYWDLVFAQEDLKVKERSLEVAQTLLRNNRERFDAGLVARIEVTRAEADLASREEAILVAENVSNNAMDRIRQLTDPARIRTRGEDLPIVPADRPVRAAAPLDEAAAVERGLEDAVALRSDLSKVKLQQEAQERALEQAGDAMLPQLDVVASARYLGLGAHFSDPLFDETFNKDTHSWSLGVVLEIPLGNWRAGAEWIRAELERRRLELQLRQLQDQIILDLRQAARTIKNAEKRIDAGIKSVTAARENYEAEEARRLAGDATSFEVLAALEGHTSAQSAELRARLDYAVATLDLDKASGTIPRKRGIVLQSQLLRRQAGP